MQSNEILTRWDALHEKGAFPYGAFGYAEKFRLFDVVLSVYRSADSWALVFEQIGYWYITVESETSNWVRVVRPDSDPSAAFEADYPITAAVITTDDVTNDPAAEQSDEEVIEEASEEGERTFARLQEFTVKLDGEPRVLRPSLDDWRTGAHADVGPSSYAANKLAPHLELFHVTVNLLRDELRLADPRARVGLSNEFELVFRDDGPDPVAHVQEHPYSPSESLYWRTLARFLAGESSALPRRQPAVERAIRRALALADDASIPAARLRDVTTLNLGDSDAVDLRGVERLTNLQVLHAFRSRIEDLAPLRDLRELREVGCAWTPLADISALAGKKHLSRVDVSYTRVSDLSALRGAPLEDLRVDGSDVRDLSPVADQRIGYFSAEDLATEPA